MRRAAGTSSRPTKTAGRKVGCRTVQSQEQEAAAAGTINPCVVWRGIRGLWQWPVACGHGRLGQGNWPWHLAIAFLSTWPLANAPGHWPRLAAKGLLPW